jgi:hypothetical protein
MRLRDKHRSHFSKRELGFLFGLILMTATSFVPFQYAASSVTKMPKPLPEIVKDYKSLTVQAGNPGMHHTGVQVTQGDFITILAKGSIDLYPEQANVHVYGPKGLLLFLLRENERLGEYVGTELIEIKENGAIYLGYRGSPIAPW